MAFSGEPQESNVVSFILTVEVYGLLLRPLDGERFNTNSAIFVQWRRPSDMEGPLRYNVQVSTDGGDSFSDDLVLSDPDVLTHIVNISAYSIEGEKVKVRVRATDGARWSSFSTSTPSFIPSATAIHADKARPWTPGDIITLTADVTDRDTDQSALSVRYYWSRNGFGSDLQLIGEATGTPFSLVWNTGIGIWDLTEQGKLFCRPKDEVGYGAYYPTPSSTQTITAQVQSSLVNKVVLGGMSSQLGNRLSKFKKTAYW